MQHPLARQGLAFKVRRRRDRDDTGARQLTRDHAGRELDAAADHGVIDTTNPVIQPGFRLAELGGLASSEVVAQHLPGARVVKVANTLPPELLGADPRVAGGRRVLFMSGDDAFSYPIAIHDCSAKPGKAQRGRHGLSPRSPRP